MTNDDRRAWALCNTLRHAATHCNTLQHTATLPDLMTNDDKRAWALRTTMDSILAGGGGEEGGVVDGVGQTLFVDFTRASQISAWKSVNDNVMGGSSMNEL